MDYTRNTSCPKRSRRRHWDEKWTNYQVAAGNPDRVENVAWKHDRMSDTIKKLEDQIQGGVVSCSSLSDRSVVESVADDLTRRTDRGSRLGKKKNRDATLGGKEDTN